MDGRRDGRYGRTTLLQTDDSPTMRGPKTDAFRFPLAKDSATQFSLPDMPDSAHILPSADWPVAEEVDNFRRHVTKTLKYLSGTVS